MRGYATSARLLLIAIVTLGYAAPAPAITAEEFRLRSGGDVVALCATPAADPLYAAAVHMCHGFGAGTYQTIMALTRHEKLTPSDCSVGRTWHFSGNRRAATSAGPSRCK